MNLMANHAMGERSQGNPSCGEKNIMKTLSQIRGSCPRSEVLSNSVRYKICIQLEDMFHKKGFELYEEVHCLPYTEDNNQQKRRADIVILDRMRNQWTDIDPTLRWELYDECRNKLVDRDEKIHLRTSNTISSATITGWELGSLRTLVRGTRNCLTSD